MKNGITFAGVERERERESYNLNKNESRKDLNEDGITLIVLVITIAVLLILAGTTMNAVFDDGGTIKKAQETQDKADETIQKNREQIDTLENLLNEEMENNNIYRLPANKDTIPYFPDITFKKIAGTNLSNGVVIQDANENEYVWIEVPKSLYENSSYNTKTTTADQKPANSEDYDKIEYCLQKYTDYYRNGTSFTDTYYSDATTGLTKTQYDALKQKMLKSVYENGGFWIGRYEAGITTSRTAKGDATNAPISKAGTVDAPVYPYTYVTCSQAQTLANMKTTANYTSSLMFGVQWDLVLKHIEVKEVENGTALATIQSALKSDSSSWGNYRDASFTINRGKYADYKNSSLSTTWTPYNQTTSNNFVNSSIKQTQSSGNGILLTTGASDTCKKMNIYDLAGNVWEWTLEYTALTNSPCANRGGDYGDRGSGSQASCRTFYSTAGSYRFLGFRSSLYK